MISTSRSWMTMNAGMHIHGAKIPTCIIASLAMAACFLSMILCFLKASMW